MISSHSLALAVLLAASQVSAQSCYYAAGKLASNNYVPCGSTSDGQQQSCCHLGDNCLEDGICFSLSTGMTYIAGCTDLDYKDGKCGAQQCDKNTQIQGIAMPCSQGTWQCCSGTGQQGDDPSKTGQGSCDCDPDAGVAFSGVTGFALTAVLPQNADGQIALVNANGQTTGQIAVPTAEGPSSSTTPASSSASPTSQTTQQSDTTSPASKTSNTIVSSTSGSSSQTDNNPSSSQTSSPSESDNNASPDAQSSGGPNLKLILGVTIPVVIVLLGLGILGFIFYRRRQASRDDFGVAGGWDPFRHAPVDSRRASRSSAIWDRGYTAVGAEPVSDDVVAEAVRRNAEQHRQHQRSDSGGLRPMSEMGGLVNWKASHPTNSAELD